MPSSSDGFPAPFDRFKGEVRPEWIDLNAHMNLAWYTVLFDYATDMIFEALDFGIVYRERTPRPLLPPRRIPAMSANCWSPKRCGSPSRSSTPITVLQKSEQIGTRFRRFRHPLPSLASLSSGK